MTTFDKINPTDIEDFLQSWKAGLIDIGSTYREDRNYREKAEKFIKRHYAFEDGGVLFKPTYTSEVIFRNNIEDALSYFVSGKISEDSGFAIKPWEKISVSDVNVLTEDNLCAVMGVLNLKSLDSTIETKIAFTFILVKVKGEIKIKIHHSSALN
ncbi:MAG: phosphoribosyl-AMP cyclohydrolase [Pseudomonadota bacterium]|nr:phosphoribosyl-AMP cyclohydrolase [Pseudomonadota bacterium]